MGGGRGDKLSQYRVFFYEMPMFLYNGSHNPLLFVISYQSEVWIYFGLLGNLIFGCFFLKEQLLP